MSFACTAFDRSGYSQAQATKTDSSYLFIEAVRLSSQRDCRYAGSLSVWIHSSTRSPADLLRCLYVAQLRFNPEVALSSKTSARTLLVLIAVASMLAIPGLGCGGGSVTENGFPNPKPLPVQLTVTPSSITVGAGSATMFTATPGPPAGFSLLWTVNPASAGTITSSGVYTASDTAGNGIVVASWTPTDPLTGKTVRGAASVTVLEPVSLNLTLTQSSGGVQTANTTQNAVVVGRFLPFVLSSDPNGREQATSGFSIPVPCPAATPNCH